MRADFYLLSRTLSETSLFVCQLLQKIYEKNFSIYVYVSSEEKAKTLDALLWTFDDTSFIPHAIYKNDATASIPVTIGYIPSTLKQQVLCNLTSEIPSFYENYERIVEIVSQEEEQRELARKKYQFYQKSNFELQTYSL